MSERKDQILSDWLDDPDGETGSVDELLAPGECQEVADSLLVHGLLLDFGRDPVADDERIKRLMQSIGSESAERDSLPRRQPNRRRRITVMTVVAAVAVVLLLLPFLSGPNDNAEASLERMIGEAKRTIDRTYSIRVVEDYPRGNRPRYLPREKWNQRPKEQIDGATLYVRGPDRYVLIRALKDGRQRITGWDGKESWAFREDGPVHVSSDPERFRGGMPGQQQDFPFININSHLTKLKSGYEIDLTQERDSTDDGAELSQLVGFRKSQSVRGPKRVEIWFEAETGTIHHMMLDGLPRGRGGPKAVILVLTDQTDLGQDFFAHVTHHEPERRVKYEDQLP